MDTLIFNPAAQQHTRLGEPITAVLIAGGAIVNAVKGLFDGDRLGYQKLWAAMYAVDTQIANAVGMNQDSDPRFDAARTPTRIALGLARADVPANVLRDYKPELQKYVSQGVPMILTRLGRTDLIAQLTGSGTAAAAPAPGGSPYQAQPTQAGISTPVMVVGGLLLLGGIYYFAKGGEKKSLGDLNTAKTKKGKVKQRAAVFAKMDDAGKTWPKTKSGVRKKKRKTSKRK